MAYIPARENQYTEVNHKMTDFGRGNSLYLDVMNLLKP